jgi:hypothetical protein
MLVVFGLLLPGGAKGTIRESLVNRERRNGVLNHFKVWMQETQELHKKTSLEAKFF